MSSYSDIPFGLTNGFHIGVTNYVLSNTFIPPNHFSSDEAAAVVRAKFAQEVELGRLSPAYDPVVLERLIGPFRVAPMDVIEQKPGKFRIVINHSYPRPLPDSSYSLPPSPPSFPTVMDPSKISINSVIDSDLYPCHWGTFSECFLLVADALPGTQAAVFDVDAAFRNIPIHPDDRRFVALSIDGLVHLDQALNFGAASSPGIWGRVADAMADILRFHGVQALVKWVDDFVFFRFPIHSSTTPVFSYDESLIWSTAERLGWPWAPDKFVPFAEEFQYIGFTWSLRDKTVQLPQKKKEKYLGKLQTWKMVTHQSLKETESLIGTLNHVTLVAPHGRAFMVSLYKFRSGFRGHRARWAKHEIRIQVRADLEWWERTLSQAFLGIDIIRPPDPSTTLLFVDASTSWGIGLVIDGRWLAWEFRDGWKGEGRDIGWGEMVAVELAARTIVSTGLSGKHIVVRSDNQGVIGALHAGRSHGTQQNLILRKIVQIIQDAHIWISTTYVNTKDNPADAPSRGIFPGRSSLHPHPPALPSHLKPFLSHPVDFHDPRLS